MKSKGIEINKNDYEKYRIPITPSNWLPKAKKQFIWSELEKRHPCFSDNFYYFMKNKLSKKGIISDVYVIEKSKLGIYRNNNKQGKVLVEGQKIPVNNDWRVILIGVILGFIIFSIFIFIINTNKEKVNQDFINENNIIAENNGRIKDFSYFDKALVKTIFSTVIEGEGAITNFNWKLVNSGEFISGTIENLYPEKLENAIPVVDIKSTKYRGKKPFFDFSMANQFVLQSSDNAKKNLTVEERKKIRDFLISENILIIEEIINPYTIILDFPIAKEILNKNYESRVLLKFEKLLADENIYITGMRFGTDDKKLDGFITLEISLSDSDLYMNNCMAAISNNLEVFYKDLNLEQKKQRENIFINDIKRKNTIVGEVNYKSGKKIIFYKTPEGKICKQEVL